jgi:hypothetical protein
MATLRKAVLSEIASGVAFLAAAVTLFFGFRGLVEKTLFTTTRPDVREVERYEMLLARIEEQKKVQADLAARLDSILSSTDAGSETSAQIAALRADIGTLTKRLDILDAAIVENPTRALSVPLLRRDLDTLKSEYLKDIDSSGKQIDRIYDQNKWFIGLMFSMAVGLIGLAISNFIQARKRAD